MLFCLDGNLRDIDLCPSCSVSCCTTAFKLLSDFMIVITLVAWLTMSAMASSVATLAWVSTWMGDRQGRPSAVNQSCIRL